MLWKTINFSFYEFWVSNYKSCVSTLTPNFRSHGCHLFKFQNDLCWQFNVGRWSDLAPDKLCLIASVESAQSSYGLNVLQITVSALQAGIKYNYALSEIFYLMAAMIAGDCFDLNISVVTRERFKAMTGEEGWCWKCWESTDWHMCCCLSSQMLGVRCAVQCTEHCRYYYLLGQPPPSSINDKSLLIFY